MAGTGLAVACQSTVSADGLAMEPVGNRRGDGDQSPAGAQDDGGDAGTGDEPSPSDPGPGDPSPGDDMPLPVERVHFIGRFDASDSAGPRFEWPATSVFARFSGTGVAATVGGADTWFEVFIDGEPHDTIHFIPNAGVDSRSLTLAAGLPAGAHSIQLYRRIESFFGRSQFLGFTVTGGDLTPSTYPFAHRIEVIGDSITCGYGNEGDGPACPFTAETENAANTYAAQTARNLDAGLSVVAWSGKGMLREYGGGTTDQMPVLYDRTLPTDDTSTYDFDLDQPDAIVINLGTNDWSVGDPGQPYIDAYVAFLTRLRTLHPTAEIFCAMGPMQNSATARQYVKDVVTARHADGDQRVHYVELAAQDGASDLGCDYHPGPSTHAQMATTLTAAIREVTGW